MILGDLEAAAELRARYIGQMRRAAGAILCDEREAARAADTALEEVCEGWPPERGRVDRWLLRLARRAAVARRKTLWGLGDAQEPRRRLRRPSKARLNTSRHESKPSPSRNRKEVLNELANPWQHPLGVEPRKSREQASASRPPMDRAGSDPAPAAR